LLLRLLLPLPPALIAGPVVPSADKRSACVCKTASLFFI
jgi:hypothetical protein